MSEFHISSLVVRALPQTLDSIKTSIAAMPGAEIHGSDAKGKMVVVLETQNQGEIAERLRSIESLSGVLNVSLIYHHVEQETPHDFQERL